MKYIAHKFLLLSVAVAIMTPAVAQTPEDEGVDTLTVQPQQVNVAFRKVEKQDLSGGVSFYSVRDLLEKDYNTFALDGAQSLAGGYNGNIWGQGALVLIDGVPRDAGADVRANEVESVTFLKSANAVALYGSRGAKGVILITTKRGQAGKREINIQANTGFYVPKRYPQYLNSWEYMTLYNEALRNDGLDELYSSQQIQNYYSATDSYRYPSIDFYSSDYLKKAYNHSDVTAEISGGSERARFYTNVGLAHESTLLNFGEGKNERNLRFNVRGNVDFKFNDVLSALVDATAILSTNRFAKGDFWGQAATLRPNRFSPLIPISAVEESSGLQALILNGSRLIDGKYLLGGSQLDPTNAFADVYASGYNVGTTRQFEMTVGLDFDLEKWLKGLSFQTRFSIDYSSGYNESYAYTYAVYEPNWYTYNGVNMIDGITKYNEDRSTGTQDVENSWYQQTLAFSAQFNYNRTFADVHNVSGMLLASGYQRTDNGKYHKISNANLGLQLTYNWKHRYYADFTAAAVHSAKMAPKKRNAFSPTFSLGWRLSQEEWLKYSPIVNELKLTVGAGILHTDLDFENYYMYKGYYSQTEGAWYSWKDGASSIQATESRRGSNPDLGFVKRKEFSIGLDGSFFNGKIDANLNYFYQRMAGMPIQLNSQYPNWFLTYWPGSSFLPYVNYNEDRRSGFDFAVNYNHKIGEVNFTLGATGNILSTEAIKRDENYEDAYQNRVGKPTDGLWGLVSDGLYHCQEDIDRAPATSSFGEVKPGDIRYVDQNGDGIIDSKDEVYLGHAGWGGAPFSYGINLTAKWKNWTFFLRGTGSTGTYGMKDNTYYWVYGDRKYSEEVVNRWTFETANTATYPRLTTLSGNNNFRSSDFWRYKSDRFDLAKIQLTYDFPTHVLGNGWVRGLKLYVSSDNLLTISGERKLMEMNIGGTPQCRYFNLGGKIQF
ncbi:SusC/RagA family TonB-linked outer membrane protein [Bacteroides sp. 51]|uniref:SusC/RagA family TonB-linked outer membrane protein n=1 Tax=Bacteroides sp. 51 TaxID=2302938 RepID=UPI0013D4322B|nr:SusC/RagA family TonB-linked outer membrane protein [Bacteroides sp. 51]NDV80879.1 SusC/RagA family TonB-linked outer membrane protein [Bacteroides sp. 51]